MQTKYKVIIVIGVIGLVALAWYAFSPPAPDTSIDDKKDSGDTGKTSGGKTSGGSGGGSGKSGGVGSGIKTVVHTDIPVTVNQSSSGGGSSSSGSGIKKGDKVWTIGKGTIYSKPHTDYPIAAFESFINLGTFDSSSSVNGWVKINVNRTLTRISNSTPEYFHAVYFVKSSMITNVEP